MSELNKNKIFEKYQMVQSNIKETALLTGRNPDDIKLVVVTKGHSIDAVRDAVRRLRRGGFIINFSIKIFKEMERSDTKT